MMQRSSLSRRQFVERCGLTLALTGVGSLATAHAADADADERTADEVLAKLLEGNRRFTEGRTNLVPRSPEDFVRDVQGQAPPAVILSCADSRVPPEFVFDQPPGQLFVLRVAGNFVGSGPVLKGSIEYAVAELGARLIIVLGHSLCGACQAAIEHIDNNDQLPGSIGDMVDYIRPVVRRVGDVPGDRLERVIKANAQENARRLETLAPLLNERVDRGALKVVGGYYEMGTGRVEILERL